MANNKITASIVVDDNGTLKKTTKKADQAAKSLDNAGRKASNFDRKMKGASGASSNASKNFSKMAQSSGGIAGIYAQIAAQVFAVSAAFLFLKNAADVTKLIAGQEALGSVTGVAYKSLTASIQEATGAQLNYREAAQAAAIGSSAGLSASQLERIGVAAKNASAVLGRDLTDSFNRLVRGITKAEPELLDELGIILRLKSATEEYAKAIDKNVNDLNAFERSQAVANEVLAQAEQKYGKLEKLMSSSGTNALNEFLVSFDQLFIQIQKFATEAMAPVFKFLTRNTGALVVALGALSAIVVKSLIPDFGAWGQAADENLKKQVKRMAMYRLSLKKTAKEVQASSAIQQAAAQSSSGAAQGLASSKGISATPGGSKGFDFILGDIENKSKKGMRAAESMFQNIEKRYDKHGNVVSGKLKGLSSKEVAIFKKALMDRKKYLKTLELAHSNTYGKMELRVKKYTAKVKLAYASLQASTASVGAAISKGLNKAFSVLGTIGLIISLGTMLFSLGKEVFAFLNPVPKAAQEASKAVESFTEKTKVLNEELERMVSVRDNVSLTLSEIVSQIGTAAGSADLPNLAKKIGHLRVLFSEGLIDESKLKKAEKAFEDALGFVSKLDDKLIPALKAFKEDGSIDLEFLTKFDANARRSASAVDAFARSLKDVKDGLKKISGEAAKSPFEDVRKTLKLTAEEGVRLVNDLTNTNLIEQQKLSAKMADYQAQIAKGSRSVTSQEAVYQTSRGDRGGRLVQKTVTKEIALTNTELRNLNELYNGALETSKNLTEEEAKKRAELAFVLRTQATLNAISEEYLNNQKAILSNIENQALKQKLVFTTEDKLHNLSLKRGVQENGKLAAKNKLLAAQAVLASTDNSDVAALSNATKAESAAQKEYNIAVARYDLSQEEADLQEKILNLQSAANYNKDSLDQQKSILDLKQRALSTLEKEANLQQKINSYAQDQIRLQATTKMQNRQENSPIGTFVFDRATLEEKDRIETERKINELKLEQAERDRTIALAKLDLEKAQFTLAESRLKLELAVLNAKRKVKTNRPDDLTDEQAGLFSSINTRANSAFELQSSAIGLAYKGATEAIRSANAELDISEKNLDNVVQIANAGAQAFETGFAQAFEDIINGTKNVTEAFGDMAMGILQAMSKIVANRIAAQLIGSLFTPATDSRLAGGPDIDALGNVGGGNIARYGGMFSNGSRVPGYAVGGISKGPDAGYPVTLHGTEAVVPLPNGKSIPVQMSGGQGQVNNVSVNVQVDGNGNSNVQSQGGGENLGKAIAAAVQQELQNQKRSGGILNPYGAS